MLAPMWLDPGIAYRLDPPETWANDTGSSRQGARSRGRGVSDQATDRARPDRGRHSGRRGQGRRRADDVAYGCDGAFRAGVTALGLSYGAGVQSTLSVWPPGEEPLPSKPWSGRGRKPSRLRHDADHRPVSAKELAMRLPAEAWKDVEWREGLNQPVSSRFAAARVRPASRDHKLVAPHPVEWLVVEWPKGEAEPTEYWLSTLPEDMPLTVLVDVIKLRWRVERDF